MLAAPLVNPEDPESAQRIVAEYAEVVERLYNESSTLPAPTRLLPYPKQTIKTAIVTCAATLRQGEQLTPEFLGWFEALYVSLADYLDDELVRVMSEYRAASSALAAAGMGHAQVHTPEWERVASISRLAGDIARAIADDTAALRREFRDYTGSTGFSQEAS